MNKRNLLLGLFFCLFLLISGWKLYSSIREKQTTFLSGAPPEEIQKALLPKTIELARMRPPAVRSTDPMRYGTVLSPAAIIEFGDYECDACQMFEQTLRKVLPTYKGDVRLIWRDLPITDSHPHALEAAIFARCAGFQAKFWEAHDALFERDHLDESVFTDIATRLKLKTDELNVCRRDAGIKQAIEQDIETAKADGVDATPFVFIGTQAHRGPLTEEALHTAIKMFLAS